MWTVQFPHRDLNILQVYKIHFSKHYSSEEIIHLSDVIKDDQALKISDLKRIFEQLSVAMHCSGQGQQQTAHLKHFHCYTFPPDSLLL